MIEAQSLEEYELLRTKFALGNPNFEVNLIQYKGVKHIMHHGTDYNFEKYAFKSFVEDYFHKDVWHTPAQCSIIYTTLAITLQEGEDFNYILIDGYGSKRVSTMDKAKLEESCAKIYTFDGRNTIYVTLSEVDLKAAGFKRGQINTEFWFYKTEFDYLDGKMPYRKFNNIYKHVDTKQRLAELVSMGEPKDVIDRTIKAIHNENVKYGTVSPTFTGLEGITNTYGLELESIAGRLEVGEEDNLNLRTVHDGSLRVDGAEPQGAEYVTGVLTGDTGLAQLYQTCSILSKRCELNHQCGLHVHVGGLDWSKEDVVYSYILAELVEQDIFSMLPKSRRKNDYCRLLTPLIPLTRLKEVKAAKNKTDYNIIIDDIYNDILMEATYSLSDKKDKTKFINSENYNKSMQHPQGAKCGYNKSYQRYCWLNYITLLYNTKGGRNSHTLEFRPHSGTFNYIKVRNWLKICLAFCKFVENHKNLINVGITLEDIISKVYPKTGDSLNKYIKERQEVFKSHTESIDYKGEEHSKKSIKEVVCA